MGVAVVLQPDNSSNHNLTFASNFTTTTRTNAAAANDNRRGTILRFVGMLLFHFHCVADWASGVWPRTTARSADPICQDCRCGNVTVIARSRYAAGQLLFKPMECSFDQISHLPGSLAFATPIAASSATAAIKAYPSSRSR
jgi:hypothetical protein